MTAILLRIIIYVAIIGFVYFGIRRLWRDFTAQFRTPVSPGKPPRADVASKRQPEVIELKRGADGVYRPPGDPNAR